MLTSEQQKDVEEHKPCLLPSHRLINVVERIDSKLKTVTCAIIHTLVHEVHLKFIEGAKAKRKSEQVPEVQRDPAPFSPIR